MRAVQVDWVELAACATRAIASGVDEASGETVAFAMLPLVALGISKELDAGRHPTVDVERLDELSAKSG